MLYNRRGHMADKTGNVPKKNTLLKVVFIIYMVATAAFLVLLFGSVSETGGPFALDLRRADFFANCLRIIADLMIIAGFWKKRYNELLIGGFLLNLVPQAFDLLVQYNGLKESLIYGLAFVATIFLIVFYIMLTGVTVSGTSKNDAYMFTKISVLICVLFWLISDIVNLSVQGMEGIFTVIFLGVDFLQMATLAVWGVMFTNYLKPEASAEQE